MAEASFRIPLNLPHAALVSLRILYHLRQGKPASEAVEKTMKLVLLLEPWRDQEDNGPAEVARLAARDAAKPHYRCRVAVARWAPRSDGAGVDFTIEADRFLHRMVRFLVGVMVDIALGRRPPSDLPHLLDATDNQAAGPPAPPQGLYLEAVRYPPDLYAED